MDQSVRVLELQGSSYDRGYMHGELLTDEILELSELEIKSILDATDLERDQIQSLSDDYLRLASDYSENLVEELTGIADGAGVPLFQILTLNLFLDLYDLWLPSNSKRITMGCTSFGLSPVVTKTRSTLIGQNLDLHEHFQKYAVVFRICNPDDTTMLVYSFAGILGCAGMNSSGIGVVINKLFTFDGKPGVPYPFIIRECLSQPNLSNAIGAAVGASRASGMNYLLCDASEIVNVETTAERCAFLYTHDGFIGHTNNYLSQSLQDQDAMPSLIQVYREKANTYVRYSRLLRCLQGLTKTSKVTLAQVFDLMRDHEDYPMSICHHTYVLTPQGSGRTIAAIVLSPEEKKIYVTNGPPCNAEFQTLNL